MNRQDSSASSGVLRFESISPAEEIAALRAASARHQSGFRLTAGQRRALRLGLCGILARRLI